MYRIALKMLVEDKAKFIGMVMSLSFSSLIIIQQAGIFIGLMNRTYGLISDTPQADVWVMDPTIKFVDDIVPIKQTDLYRIKTIEGVAWAVPLFKGAIRARQPTGQFQTCILVGVDGATLIGAPHTMIDGSIQNLRQPGAVIVSQEGALNKLAVKTGPHTKRPMRVGDVFELNDQRVDVVGICKTSKSFQSQPTVYTTYKQALQYAPSERKLLSFVLVKAQPNVDPQALCKKITQKTALAAYTKSEFEKLTVSYFLKNTGIPINFGFAVFLGLLVGASIAGLIFYNFINDNLKYLSLFLVMGASRWLLIKMSMLQALWVALLGWGIGAGGSSLFALLSKRTELTFYLSWSLLLGTGLIMILICIIALLVSISKIFKIELWTMFR